MILVRQHQNPVVDQGGRQHNGPPVQLRAQAVHLDRPPVSDQEAQGRVVAILRE